EYRRATLDTLEAMRPFTRALGDSGKAFDDLAKHVKTAKYEQSQAAKETEQAKKAQEELKDTIQRLSNEVKGSRNVWAGRIASDEEFRESTTKARAELVELLKTVERGSNEYKKITQEIAYAQRGLDSVNKVAS